MIKDVVAKYAKAGPPPSPFSVHNEFDELDNHCHRDTLAEGISELFHSRSVAAFGELLSQLYSRSDPAVRTGLIAVLLSAVRPVGASHSTALAEVIDAFQRGELTADKGHRVSPGDVQQLATHAVRQDVSMLERVSDFYSQHPHLVKTLDPDALRVILTKMARKEAKLFVL